MSGKSHDRKEPLGGIALKVEETGGWRLGPSPNIDVEELEIGATGPNQLQFVMISERRRATVLLSAEQARWLAHALNYWAESSEKMVLN